VFAGRTAKNVGKQMVSESIKGIIDKTNLQKLGVGIVAAVISNSIEKAINENENTLYAKMIDEIIKSQDSNLTGITVQSNKS